MEEINFGVHTKYEEFKRTVVFATNDPTKESTHVVPLAHPVSSNVAPKKEEQVEVFADVEGKGFWESNFGLQVAL
jgi:hypothetical protein